MAKRSNFDRKARDFYETWDINAVKPVIAHLRQGFTYIDPCTGSGYIKQHMTALTPFACVGEYEAHPLYYLYRGLIQADATNYQYPKQGDFFITNPPWERHLLHAIIWNLMNQKPTWLLFDADWIHTKQIGRDKTVKDLMKHCIKIVSIGRVKWIKDSKHSGKDNCAWYLFDINHNGATEFIER